MSSDRPLSGASIVDALPVPAAIVDARGRVVRANRALAACLALDPVALTGADLAACALEPAALGAFLAAGSDAARSFELRTGRGQARCLDIVVAKGASSEGDLVIALDRSARDAAERTLRQERDRYLDMIRAGSDWFHETEGGARGRIRLFRPSRDPGDPTIRATEAQWPDDVADASYDAEAHAAWLRRLEAGEPYRDVIHRVTRKDGSYQYIRTSAVPFHHPDGTLAGYRGLSIDATAQVEAERALRASELRLRRGRRHLAHAQRIAATGSAEHDLLTEIEEWSDEMYRILGVDRTSFTSHDLLSLVYDADRARVAAAMAAAHAGVRPTPCEFRIVRPTGEVRTIYGETEVQRDEAGRPIRLLSVFRDVTELRAAERRQRDMERQLAHAQKIEALGTLAGGVAHELNNNLVPILALTKLLADSLPADDPHRDDLALVVQASLQAHELVQRVLAFSRRLEGAKERIALAPVVRSGLALACAELSPQVEIVEEIASVSELYGDAGQLRQVVIDLVANAVEAIGDRRGRVVVALDETEDPRSADADGTVVRLAVADTGCGMDEATVGRVFDPFFTTKGVGQGVGLGLAAVHGIVTSHGGWIEVASQVGAGSRFSVFLPRAAAEAEAAVEPVA